MILLQLKMQLCGHLDMVNVFELMAREGQQLSRDLIVELPLPADAKNASCVAQGEFVAELEAE